MPAQNRNRAHDAATLRQVTRRAVRRRASAPLLQGDRRYELGDELGRGGMGEVRSAFDAQIGREVALKRMHSDRPSHDELARFLREARIQGRLQHPAIPPVHELGIDDQGRPYFAMTRLDGVMLSDVLRAPRAYPKLTRQRLLHAFVDVCHAIELAHAQRIVHRDIKPSNVLLGERGEVYVIDWGIARELKPHGFERGVVSGTPGYMPPEQEGGDDDLDERVDVYALGCVLFEILTGEPRATCEPPSLLPPTQRPDIPPELEHACRLATELDRDDRLASVSELSGAVQRYLDGDRDLERRRELATQHLTRAHTALVTEPDEARRRAIAMREAGRALALDPTLAGAARLVTRLMLQPPIETPKAVIEELAVLDRETDRQHLRRVAILNASQLVLVPILAVLGIHDVPYLVAFGVLSVVNVGLQFGAVKSERFMRRTSVLAALAALAMCALIARMFTPFLCAPAVVAVSVMSFALSSLARQRRVILKIAGLGLLGILGVWGAEALGFISQTTSVVGGTLVLRSPLDGAAQFPLIQAWQLRQLL